MGRKNRSNSLIALYFIVIVLAVTPFIDNRWKTEKVITWDVQEYYMYLPAVFIHHDPGFTFVSSLPPTEQQKYWLHETAKGKFVGRMSLGMALAYLPFFWLGHVSAFLSGAPQSGYSVPYQFWIAYTGFFYLLFGLVFLRKTLLIYFSDKVSAAVLVCITLGTNLYYYSIVEGAMAHATLFSLFAIYLYCVIGWYRTFHTRYVTGIALSLGLAILIRPVCALAVIIFLLYDVYDASSLTEKIHIFKKHFLQLLLIPLLLVLIAMPQLIYWKVYSGQFLYYSYMHERFFFDRPHILQGLFGLRKGWFIYTPIMLAAVFGIGLMSRYCKSLLYGTLLFLICNVYVVFSWWCWWYGGSFGARALIESYAFLSIPLGCFFTWASRKKYIRYSAIVFSLACIVLNIYQGFQYKYGVMPPDSMTAKAYGKIFGKMEVQKDIRQYTQEPDYDKAMKGEE
jgi:hypothetical protein